MIRLSDYGKGLLMPVIYKNELSIMFIFDAGAQLLVFSNLENGLFHLSFKK